jgi:hypothetical protein
MEDKVTIVQAIPGYFVVYLTVVLYIGKGLLLGKSVHTYIAEMVGILNVLFPTHTPSLQGEPKSVAGFRTQMGGLLLNVGMCYLKIS